MAQSHYSFGTGTQSPSPLTPTGPTFASMSPSGHSTPVGPSGHGRKRGADSPPSEPGQSRPPDSKRRRPNLANGFQAMSINTNTGGLPSSPGWLQSSTQENPQSFATHDDHDDDGLEPTLPPLDGDVGVEVLPEHISPRLKRPRAWKRNSSFSSTSPSEDDDYESDATFRIPSRPPPPTLPTSVDFPPETPIRASFQNEDGVRVEVLDSASKRKQRGANEPQPKKRRREGMDVDMDTLPEGSYGPGWYEPEKDRVIITSLSSPESSPPGYPRSLSPESERHQYSYDENRHLTQPGNQGFTISPSLLTHIINARREQFAPDHPVPERGLVLYRPVGLENPGDPVVQEWQWDGNVPLTQDSDRFEEVDDDEDLMTDAAMQNGMNVEGGASGWEEPDEAMEIE